MLSRNKIDSKEGKQAENDQKAKEDERAMYEHIKKDSNRAPSGQ